MFRKIWQLIAGNVIWDASKWVLMLAAPSILSSLAYLGHSPEVVVWGILISSSILFFLGLRFSAASPLSRTPQSPASSVSPAIANQLATLTPFQRRAIGELRKQGSMTGAQFVSIYMRAGFPVASMAEQRQIEELTFLTIDQMTTRLIERDPDYKGAWRVREPHLIGNLPGITDC